MKKVLVIGFLLSGMFFSVYSQSTSLNNHTGAWEDGSSWTGGVAPPVDLTTAYLDLNVDGYITRTGDLSAAMNTDSRKFIVNDTLVILGNLTFQGNAAPLAVGPDAVLIVIGNVSSANSFTVENGGIIVVSGNMTFHPGSNDTYDDSGGGELFVGGNVTGNPASSVDIWDELDDRYPVIYDFVMCGGGPSCILPVKLSYFHAAPQGDVVELTWATTTEENFQKFIVQRSSNGIDFESLEEVGGKGFDIHDIESKYSYSDRNPLTGFNYYRLKAVDRDDSYEYFGVKAVKVTAPKSLAVYPNPSTGDFIAFDVNFTPEESAMIVLVDQLGVEIFRAPANSGERRIALANRLHPGIYFPRYVSNDFERVTRIVVRG